MPEIDPGEAREHAAVVATGRSDYPNQINNVLAFPGVFRGLLDASASRSTTACSGRRRRGDRRVVTADELNANYIIPSVFHADVHSAVAAAVRHAAEQTHWRPADVTDLGTPLSSGTLLVATPALLDPNFERPSCCCSTWTRTAPSA